MTNKTAVFLGSRNGSDLEFSQQAFDLGKALAEKNHIILWGGGFSGGMGALSKGVASVNGHMEAYVAKQYFDSDYNYPNHVKKMVCCEDDAERNKIFVQADFQIAMAGGIGSLLEIVHTINHKVYHDKDSPPLIIVSTNDFYCHLGALLETIISNEFNDELSRSRYQIVNSPQQALNSLGL